VGNELMREKRVDGDELTVREKAFVELVASFTDTRSIAAKAASVGYKNPKTGYRVCRRPLVAQAIQRRVDEGLRLQRTRGLAVLADLANRAIENGDNSAARTFLESIGMIQRGGVNVGIAVNTSTQAVGGFPERLRRAFEERREMLKDAGFMIEGPSVTPGPGHGNGGEKQPDDA
jgi:hypothetical protein